MCCSKNSMQISAVITEKMILLVRSLNTHIVDKGFCELVTTIKIFED